MVRNLDYQYSTNASTVSLCSIKFKVAFQHSNYSAQASVFTLSGTNTKKQVVSSASHKLTTGFRKQTPFFRRVYDESFLLLMWKWVLLDIHLLQWQSHHGLSSSLHLFARLSSAAPKSIQVIECPDCLFCMTYVKYKSIWSCGFLNSLNSFW